MYLCSKLQNIHAMDTSNNIIYDNGIFTDGKYEILFCSGFPQSPDEDYNHVIQTINGADVNLPYIDLKYEINWKEKGKSVKSVSFLMPEDKIYLGDVFITSPYGLIKKNRTGVGATTLELHSKRNSIVVVPTRALAYEKAKNSRIGESDRYSILYVGGRINGFKIPSIEDYLSDNEIRYKKFIVVIDSLDTLLKEIGKEHFKDYFIMFDEIDSYQYDNSYRPNMERNFDYYFKFPETQRCLVSATIGQFSNTRIENEPVINVTFSTPAPRSISLIHTNDVLSRTKIVIEQLIEKYPNDKILIALNLVTRGMLPIINSLSPEIQSQCGILCSSKSKKDANQYYKEIINRELPSKITFMSCTYFVGIDINERFHLISVADIRYPFTLLSTDKLTQIAGRCRHHEGLLSETVIYNTINQCDSVDCSFLKQDIVSDAELLSTFASDIKGIRHRFPQLIRTFNDISEDEILEYSKKSYHGSSKISLVRQSEVGITPSYFNIDNIIIQVNLKNTLYSQPENLYQALKGEGNNVDLVSIEKEKEEDIIPQEVYEEVEERCFLTEEEERKDLITQLRDKTSLSERAILAQGLKNDCKRVNSVFLEHFIELQKYVPFEKLVEILPQYDNSLKYKTFYNAVLIWALDENHPIKCTMREKFPIGGIFTNKEIEQGMNAIWNGILHYGMLKSTTAVRKLGDLFCKVGDRTSAIRNRKKENVYPILSYDVLDLDCEPVERIPSSENMTRILKIR